MMSVKKTSLLARRATPIKKTTALAVLVISALGLVLLLAAVPSKHRLKIYLDNLGTDQQTLRYGRELAQNPIARFLDPEGHNELARALAIEARLAAGGHRELDELGLDTTFTLDHHQIEVYQARVAGIIALALIFLGNLIAFILWVRDLQSGGWIFASTLLCLALMPIVYAFLISLPLALVLAPLLLIALVTMGRQSMVAMRLRTPKEL
jgi:hypothetical protein